MVGLIRGLHSAAQVLQVKAGSRSNSSSGQCGFRHGVGDQILRASDRVCHQIQCTKGLTGYSRNQPGNCIGVCMHPVHAKCAMLERTENNKHRAVFPMLSGTCVTIKVAQDDSKKLLVGWQRMEASGITVLLRTLDCYGFTVMNGC